MNKKLMLFLTISLLISGLIVFVGFKSISFEPKEVYAVYLEGERIGYVKSKDDLEDYINNEQQALKEKYNVDKIYTPRNLDIVKEITYTKNISTTKKIYNEIKDITPFTLNGYKITIKGVEEKTENGTTVAPTETLYVIDKKVFTESVDKTVRSFINSSDYDNFLNDTQPEIVTTGKVIEDIYIANDITIKKTNIPADEKIYTSIEELTKYLVFGTTLDQEKYSVIAGDTIKSIAFNNKMSVEEFLIANPEFKNENNLLFPGQQVKLGILEPKFKTIEEEHIVELQENKFTTEVKYDNNLEIGKTKIIQEGQNGMSKLTKKVQKANGEILTSVITNKEEIKPIVNKVIIKGGKSSYYADAGYWMWPTNIPYTINSSFGYRWGILHDGVDIGGTGYGSPIRASKSGTVVEASSKWPNGIYVLVAHENNYYSMYAHLSARYVSVGDKVGAGDVIGAMGQTGLATGTHLHFGIYRGYPFRGGRALDPMGVF